MYNATSKCLRLLLISPILILLFSCGGGGGGGGGGGNSTPPPIIYGGVIGFPTGLMPPVGIKNATAIITDSSSGANITTATVTVNGVALSYNAAPNHQEYEGNVTISPGGNVTLNVTVGGNTYTASGTEFASYPTISAPVSGTTWIQNITNILSWSGGTPTINAVYALGILDSNDPNGMLIWPSNNNLQVEQMGTTSVSIPANSLTLGNRIVFVGIATAVSIPHADPNSGLAIIGVDYVPITVSNPPQATVVSIAVTPANINIAKGGTQQFTATGTFSDNTTVDLTTQVAWASSDKNIATTNNTGLATGTGIGFATLKATSGTITGSTSISVVPGFAPAIKYPDPSSTLFLGNTAIGDLNGDGRNDVVVIPGSNITGTLLIYYQNSMGGLNSPVAINLDILPASVVIADVNNDGHADLIVSGNSTTATSGFLGRIVIFRQDPVTHTLGTPQEYTLSTDNVGPLAIADLNGDGLLDVVSAGTGSGSNGVVSFLFQGGGGLLGSEVTYTSVPIVVDGELHVGDMNNDGFNDIVLQSGPKQLAVIRQLSPGTFSTTPDFYTVQTSYWPFFRSFALGDLNGDGRTDLAVADSGNYGYLNIFLQNTSGILTGPTLLTVDVQNEVHIADLNGDGLNDIIILADGDIVRIFYQSPDHSFPTIPLIYYLPTSSAGGTSIHQALSVGDVTGDGLPDIVASWLNEGIFVLPRLP